MAARRNLYDLPQLAQFADIALLLLRLMCDVGYARHHTKENIYLAHRLLGQIGDRRLELRHMLVVMNLLIVTTGGGNLTLTHIIR